MISLFTLGLFSASTHGRETIHANNWDSLEALMNDPSVTKAEAMKELGDNLLRRLQDEIPTTAPTEFHGRFKIPDGYHEMCHLMVNAFRTREGLPALQRWREMEKCSDRGARFDQANDVVHGSIASGVGCVFDDYFPIAQNTCKNWDNSEDAIEKCTEKMWDEKHEKNAYEVSGPYDPTNEDPLGFDMQNHAPDTTPVDDNRRRRMQDSAQVSHVRCELDDNGQDLCGHYYNLRGGREGYNIYDRVACGFSIRRIFFCNGGYELFPCEKDTEGQVDLWINQNFGRGTEQVSVYHPDDTPYGFECGGNKDVYPLKDGEMQPDGQREQVIDMLIRDDCRSIDQLPLGEFQYDGCPRDYRWWGCTQLNCDRTKDPSERCEDRTVENGNGSNVSHMEQGEILGFLGDSDAGYDACSWLKSDGQIHITDPLDLSTGCPGHFTWPPANTVIDAQLHKRSYYWYYTFEVCQKTCGKCACSIQEFDEGFSALPTPRPTVDPEDSDPNATPAPTMPDCPSLRAGKCKKTDGCVYDNVAVTCMYGECEDILERVPCKFNDKCAWEKRDGDSTKKCYEQNNPTRSCVIPVEECISRCYDQYGEQDWLTGAEETYKCAKGCAGMKDLAVTNYDRFCNAEKDNLAEYCVGKCRGDEYCAYGCQYWSSWDPNNPLYLMP